jgi:lipoprotein-anchoring transpeptidase ErfK/SrfK
MNTNLIQAREFVANAREALRRGDNDSARDFGEKAALLAPDFEDAWLILVASDSNPEDALAYARKALELNPQSVRAQKSVEWAEGKLHQAQAGREAVVPQPVIKPVVKSEPKKANPPVESKSNKRILLYGGTFAVLLCMVFGFAAWSAVSSPAFASIVENAPAPTQENLWAQVDVAKPSVTPIDASAFAQVSTPTPAPVIVAPTATLESLLAPTNPPTSVPTEAPTLIPAATETPGTLAMEIVANTPTSAYVPPTAAPQLANEQPSAGYPEKGNGVRWIDVNLSQQMVYAYEGDVIVNSFVVSTGTAQTPTVTGKYKIWIKLKSTTMSGPGYHLTNVPYTMYFYKGYGLHGTYWHNNFGTPMSHGCVNLSISDAEWLYYWALEGTVVNVHY